MLYKEFEENKNNSHKMWKTINSLLHMNFADTNFPPNNIKIDGKTLDNKLAVAEHF